MSFCADGEAYAGDNDVMAMLEPDAAEPEDGARYERNINHDL